MKANNVDLINKTILITGSAGFIGANLAQELLKTVESVNIIGIDNMNDYYDVNLKEYRCKKLKKKAQSIQNVHGDLFEDLLRIKS